MQNRKLDKKAREAALLETEQAFMGVGPTMPSTMIDALMAAQNHLFQACYDANHKLVITHFLLAASNMGKATESVFRGVAESLAKTMAGLYQQNAKLKAAADAKQLGVTHPKDQPRENRPPRQGR